MDSNILRAWWAHKQALDGSMNGASSHDVLVQTGWARSVGGAAPYLTLLARNGASREQIDRDVSDLKIHELPSARGCTYVVPSDDFKLALRVSQGFADVATMQTAHKLGVTDKEIDALRQAISKALKAAPLTPEEIRDAAGGAVRNLGPEGAKKGITTTLPVALSLMQSSGDIRRIPINGRLDQQRYRYALWNPNPLLKFKLGDTQAYSELAKRYFRWIGPATQAEFQWFSGLGAKAAKLALEPLGLVPLESDSPLLLFPADLHELRKFKLPSSPYFSLVSSLDGICLLRRDIQTLLAREDRSRQAFVTPGIAELPSHAILDRGRLIGLWEFDVETDSIAWTSFIPANKVLRSAIGRTQEAIRAQLGDARSFSLDSPKSRAPRVAAIRAAPVLST